MRFFKQVVRARVQTDAAPAMVRAARDIDAQAQALAAAQQDAANLAAFAPPPRQPPTTPAAGNVAPIAGVPIELYARVSKQLASRAHGQSRALGIAGAQGVSAENWSVAVAGWDERIRRDPAVGRLFDHLYTGA